MTPASYVFKNVLRNPRRTMLTAMSIAVSMALIAVLQTILLEITKPASMNESAPRLVVRHRTSMSLMLPRHYEDKIRAIPGIVDATPMNWFGGIWKDDSFENFFPRFSVDPEHFFNVYFDYRPGTPEQLEAFKRERTGTLVGAELMKRYGWKIGDKLMIQGDIYPVDLELKIVGTIEGEQTDWSIFQQKYLDELMGEEVGAGIFFALAEDTPTVDRVIPLIEEKFRNSEAEVKAETEKAFQLSFVEMLGNIKVFINSIVSVVVFAVMMIAAGTMALAIRERTREIATLKAIGYSRGHVMAFVVGEGMLVSTIGGVLGLGGAWLLLPVPKWMIAAFSGIVVMAVVGIGLLLLTLVLPERKLRGLRERISRVAPTTAVYLGIFVALLVLHMMPPLDWFKFSGGMIRTMSVRGETLVLGAIITAFLGLSSSLWPAWQASRLSVLDGLRTME